MQDVRHAVRALRAAPILTAVAILSIALGIGANTAIFSLANSLLLRALPVMEPERLVTVRGGLPYNQGLNPGGMTYPVWDQIRQRAETFDGAIAWSVEQRFRLTEGGEMRAVDGVYVSGGFFTTLGVPAVVGRTFTSSDDVLGGGGQGPVAIISYGLWQRRFGGAAAVIGAQLVVDRVPFTIVGVTPARFSGVEVGRTFDVALPITAESLLRGRDSVLETVGANLTMMLRLKRGQSLEAATAALRAVQPQVREATRSRQSESHDRDYLQEPFRLVPAAAGTSRLRQRYERPLVALLVIGALVLIVACANIANLLLARADARRHEFSIRLALGASRWRLARPLLIESVILAGVGAAFGLLFGAWGSRALFALVSTWRDRYVLDLSFDWRVLTFTVAMTSATGVLFGTVPALRASRAAPIDALKEHGRGTIGGAGASLSSGLVVVQVALSLVLVVAAGLFVRTFERLSALPRGFDSEGVLVINVDVTRSRVALNDRIASYQHLTEAAAATPGVARAAGSLNTPMGIGFTILPMVDVPGARRWSEEERQSVLHFVTPGWFATYGTAIRVGRDVDDHDTKGAPPVMLVNEAFVRRFFPTATAIGGIVDVAVGPQGQTPVGSKTIVGVVRDMAARSLRDQVPPTMYAPLAQWNMPFPLIPFFSISLRASAGSPMLTARAVTAALTTVDHDLDFVFPPHLLADQVNGSLTQERIVGMLSGYFGALALLLAALGLYGVTSHAVSRRRTEIGVRMALGAAPQRVIRMVLARVTRLVALGMLVGVFVSLWASTFVATLLYGLAPRDPVTLIGASVTLAAVGAVAGWLPARRASRLDPAEVLRES
jgi:putative ABC transport system permease protein